MERKILMKRIIVFLFILNLSMIVSAQDWGEVYEYEESFSFTVVQDCSWKNDLGLEEVLEKGESLFLRDEAGIGFSVSNSPKEIEISVKNADDEILYVPIQFLSFDDNKKTIPEIIENYFWVPSYYYDQINSKSDRFSIIYKNEPFWKDWKNQFENASTRMDDFFLGYYGFNSFYFFARNSYIGSDEATFLVKTEETSENSVKYKIYRVYSHFQQYTKRTAHPQEKFLPLYKKETPFYIYLVLDGDYMNMYIDEISEKNLFQTLIRTTSEACVQIENWIKGESDDLSKVIKPKHGNSSTQVEVGKMNVSNVSINKTMTVKENLKLRSGEATTTQVLTVMAAGTKVKILETGKKETIDGITSNWVKVEVLAGAIDRDGKLIKAGTVGWCYGGYLEEFKSVDNTDLKKRKNK